MHRVERVVLEGALVQRHGTDEQIALVDGATGFGKSRRDQHDSLAAIGTQRIHHRPDIACVRGIEGRADLEQHVARAATTQPCLGRARARHRKSRLDRAALQRHHDGVHLRQLQIVSGHTDGLHRAQSGARQRIGEIGGAGVVVGDAA